MWDTAISKKVQGKFSGIDDISVINKLCTKTLRFQLL